MVLPLNTTKNHRYFNYKFTHIIINMYIYKYIIINTHNYKFYNIIINYKLMIANIY